jgi:hypothetical protein
VETDDRAIVVGVSHYPGLGNLSGPENDATAFADWLCSPLGGNVPPNNIDLIVSSDFKWCQDPVDAEPTTQTVKKAIDRLCVIGASSGYVGRRLYLYMSGHGLAPELEKAALVMANAAKRRTGHHVPGPPYAEWFRKSKYFHEVVLFMDCCFKVDEISPPQLCHLDRQSPTTSPVRYYYALAADLTQPAHELPDESGEMHGVFTASVLAALWQGPPSGGDVTGAWLEEIVPQFMTTRLGDIDSQVPKFQYQRNDDVVFVKRTAVSYRVRIHASPSDHGREVEMWDGTLALVPPTDRSNGIWEWELGPGIYRFGYSGGPHHFRQLMGEEREINVEL